MNIYIKWFLIVGLNAVLGILLSEALNNVFNMLGMFSGILTWYLVYVLVDTQLQKNGYLKESRKLTLSAVLRIPLQFSMAPDILAGMLAMETSKVLGFDYPSLNIDQVPAYYHFLSTYFTTVFTGLYLSVMCMLIYGLVSLINVIWARLAIKHS